MTIGEDGHNHINDYRTSNSAMLRRRQTPVVQCLEERFADFQGGIDPDTIEPLQVVKYRSNQEVSELMSSDEHSSRELF